MLGIFAWWNLVFLIGFPASLFFLLKHFLHQAHRKRAGLIRSQETHLGASFDADHHFDHDFTRDDPIGARVERASFLSGRLLLEFLGEHRIPRTLLAGIFWFFLGCSGLVANGLLHFLLQDPFVFLWFSLVAAFLLSVSLTRFTVRLLSKHTSLSEHYVRQGKELIGCEGGAIDRITLDRGMAQVCDRQGNLHRIYCRIEPQGTIIQEGDQVLIIDYDRGDNRYIVKQNPFSTS